MSIVVGVPKEKTPGETRVALTTTAAAVLIKGKMSVVIEAGAGSSAGFSDDAYKAKGAAIAARGEVFAQADILLQVRCSLAEDRDFAALKPSAVVIGFCDPLGNAGAISEASGKGISLISMELIPRITRAQSMDALSSQANIAGYKAVLMAANASPKIFPMLMTAAGTLQAVRVFVIGVGVAGLQAISTARRLGAVVSAFDVRPAVKEQVQSVGAKFVELPMDTANAQDQGGYAKALTPEQQKKQAELMAKVIAESDVVITTALVPGRPAPKLVPASAVEKMQPGSVIVDLAAERGGNCELTEPGKTVVKNGVTIIGHTNIPATVPLHTSQMYANNLAKLLGVLVNKEGVLNLDLKDEIVAGSLVCHGGSVVHPRVLEILGTPAKPAAVIGTVPAAAAPVADRPIAMANAGAHA
ncbi:MAG TPA: Re/Si-specific NAD(P)(+) transhydrogenase subunit alpha [Phycisphaerae bacterium]|nr:Re/Si-specific NAD(P)(+) transhydrogenase subunit alpha [Phycisphaerae bacterium]